MGCGRTLGARTSVRAFCLSSRVTWLLSAATIGAMTESTSPNTETPAATPAKKRVSKSTVAAVVLGVVVALSLLIYSSAHGGGNGSHDDGAVTACEAAVKAQLKAPATAKFSGENVSHGGTVYTVSGNVDAENGFSALVRNSFSCQVLYDEPSKSFGRAVVTALGD